MEIHQESFYQFCSNLPSLVTSIVRCEPDTTQVHVEEQASVHTPPNARRHVTRKECVAAGITHSIQVVMHRRGFAPALLFELPRMEDGEFVVRGKQRMIMLRKRRATAPIRMGDCVTIMGAKYNVKTRQIMVPGAKHWVNADKVQPWNKVDPAEYIRYCDRKGLDCAWHTSDINITRIQTPGVLLEQLVAGLLRREASHVERRGGEWRHAVVTSALESALATGNWRAGLVGVTQLRNYNNQVAQEAQFRTVVGSTNGVDRYVHPSTWCYFCVSETPEGEKCGLVHHLTDNVAIEPKGDAEPPHRSADGPMHLFWNGVPHGKCQGPIEGITCVTRDDEVWAWTDAGRMRHKRAPDPTKHMLGLAASMIPFAQHNQSPRISYYSAMSKQALALPNPAMPTKHTLCYAQEALVTPRNQAGINVVIAILPLGYNIEDALVFSRGAIDRGLFRSLCTTVVYAQPTETIPRIGDLLPGGETVVDVTFNGEIYTITRQKMRVPEIGDKFASRAGQKGTIGIIMPQEDLPFNKDGITPDVVINPHAFPSRMTVSQIYETACGLLATVGVKVDSRPFAPVPPVQSMLQQHGWHASGKELMTSGTTGEPLEARVFLGLCFYQRLHHMAKEKCYARKGGPVDAITLQPVAGRKRGGGLRLGEMEKDCIHSSGAMGVLQERMDCIGKASVQVCETCAQPTINCAHTHTQPIHVTMPHASKLLLMELQSMLIKVELS